MLVEIPDQAGWVLEERARNLDLPVEVVLSAALATMRLAPPSMARPVYEAVGVLVDAGKCDADIAALLHETPGWVARARRRLGKAANRRYVATVGSNPD